MSAVNNNVGNSGDGRALETPDEASLRLSGRINENADVVKAIVRYGGDKCKVAIGVDDQIVASIVQQLHATTCAHEAHDRAADGVENSRADDLNVGDVGVRGSRAVGDGAGLVGTGRLGENRYLVPAAGGNQGGHRKGTVGSDGKTIAAVVLQDDPRAGFGESSNRPTDGDSSSRAGDLNVADIGVGGASSVGNRASLRRRRWLGTDCYKIGASDGNGGLKGERVARGDRKVIAAIVLQDKTGPEQADDVTSDGKGPRGTRNLNVGDIGGGCAASAGHRASLWRVGRRRGNGNIIPFAVNDGRFEGECAVSTDREIIAGVVLKDQPSAATGQAGDHPADTEWARTRAGAGTRARGRLSQVAAHEKRRSH